MLDANDEDQDSPHNYGLPEGPVDFRNRFQEDVEEKKGKVTLIFFLKVRPIFLKIKKMTLCRIIIAVVSSIYIIRLFKNLSFNI